MKSAIRRVPSDLPHVKLYIDDLVEIESIVKKVLSEQKNTSWEGFEYEIDDKIRLTTHEELAEHRGSSSNFKLIAIYSIYSQVQRTEVLRFYSLLEPRLSVYWGSNEDHWATYAQVAQVLEPRKLRLKNLLEAVPWEMGWIVPASMVFLLVLLLAAGFRHGIPRGFASVAEIGGAIFVLVAIIVFFSRLFGKSKVLFRYSRLDLYERMRARKELTQKIVLLLIGALLGCLSTIAASYVMKGR